MKKTMIFKISMIAAVLLPFCFCSGLSYNYYDEIAQSYCTSHNMQPAYVFAIRRDCQGKAPTCNTICRSAKSDMLKAIGNQRSNVACFDAIHIRKTHAQLGVDTSDRQPDAGKVSQVTYGYGKGGCTWTPNHCGPNFCCCKAF